MAAQTTAGCAQATAGHISVKLDDAISIAAIHSTHIANVRRSDATVSIAVLADTRRASPDGTFLAGKD